MSMLRWVSNQLVDLSDEVASLFYKCTGCGACTDACLHGVDVGGTLYAAREAAVRAGHRVFGTEAVERDEEKLAQAVAAANQGMSTSEPDAVYVPGCELVLRDPGAARQVAMVLEEVLGARCVVGPSMCCGAPLRAAGLKDAFDSGVSRFYGQLPTGAPVYVGPGVCFDALVNPPASSQSLGHSSDAVIPVLSALADGMDVYSGPIWPLSGAFAVFDGCHHLRKVGVGDASERILRRVCNGNVERLRWAGSSAHCCGGAGGYDVSSPVGSREAAKNILQMAADTGAKSLVSFDSHCALHLASAAEGTGVRVWDGFALTARALRLDGEGRQ